jgi:hypothetical protein
MQPGSHLLGFLVFLVLLEQDKALEDGSQRDVLLRGQLCALAIEQQHRRVVGHKARDRLRVAWKWRGGKKKRGGKRKQKPKEKKKEKEIG